jgi:FtsP/CotA-like multicopper oxidase with cupredoxin domain
MSRTLHLLGGVCALLLLLVAAPAPAPAQAVQHIVPCPPAHQSLLTMPEITSHNTGKLTATLKLIDGVRTLWDSADTTRCATQYLRSFVGYDTRYPTRWPNYPDPMPGPTLRAKVGDLVEILFFNEVNPNNYGASLDRSDKGTTNACDKFKQSTSGGASKQVNPPERDGPNDMPNCLHGSTTANVHFHGTHTTPSTTGDNVLLFIRPALRDRLQPTEAQAAAMLKPFFTSCEQHGPPKLWTDMPPAWQDIQKKLVMRYDATAHFQGGSLPMSMQLWPHDAAQIAAKQWPQYQVGADPICFGLPKPGPAARMGQAPGTHWYHAHKHGSTALNVANGMTGALIIEGQYDADLNKFYGAGRLQQRVMMLEQLATVPFAYTGGTTPLISVNGRLNPVAAMRPGEVQMWRIINGAWRDAVQFAYFQNESATPCATATAPPQPPQPVQWRQIAQDGVQFNVVNYQRVGTGNHPFNLAPANRADLLVKAPAQTGKYTLCVVRSLGENTPSFGTASALLTVEVKGTAVSPAMDFIPNGSFPQFPQFLFDIQPSEVHVRRELVFGPNYGKIDGKRFEDGVVNQTMRVNTAEEWTVKNEANDKAHPFHIHINPFQVIEAFEPNAPEAKDPANPCFVNPNDPATFKPCPARQPLIAPGPPWWIWWDTFPIPTGQKIPLSNCTKPADCTPAAIRPYVRCEGTPVKCTEYIPGWFKMRTRFADFTGQYVLHCHILIHEDRGMMQLVEVVPERTLTTHH